MDDDPVDELFAIIMAGGAGTRLWPASRAARPKQFLRIAGQVSLIEATRARLAELLPPERILVVGDEQHAQLLREALPDLPAENILTEPVGRNTLPCVTVAALEIERRHKNALHVVLPADHVIEPAAAFRETVRAAARVAARSDALVTFGIRPSYPATGYGYIESGARAGADPGALRVERFVEKPDLETATRFLTTGRFLWNSGVFVWRSRALLAALREHAPAVLEALSDVLPSDLETVYVELPSISIDIGVMEKAHNVLVMPVDFTWSDVGSWSALEPFHPQDTGGNRIAGGGKLLQQDARNCMVYSEGDQLVALVGTSDLVVVHAAGATLVCARDRVEDVRKLVDQIRADGAEWL